MVHLALCAVVGLSTRRGFTGGGGRTRRSPRRRITLSYIYMSVFCIRLVFTSAPFRPGGPELPPHPVALQPRCPLPPVFTVESHTEQIGTEQSSEAEETRSHCSGNWTLLSLSAPSHHPPPSQHHPHPAPSSLHILPCLSPPTTLPPRPPAPTNTHAYNFPTSACRGSRWQRSAKACYTNQRRGHWEA